MSEELLVQCCAPTLAGIKTGSMFSIECETKERMMQELDKKKVQEELEQLKLDNAELEKQLDQNIELMKRLEIEKKVEQTIQKMVKLAEEQRTLGKETENAKGKDNSDLQEKQRQVDNKFQQLKQDLEQIRKDYKELASTTSICCSFSGKIA